jgi:hypothetical protein
MRTILITLGLLLTAVTLIGGAHWLRPFSERAASSTFGASIEAGDISVDLGEVSENTQVSYDLIVYNPRQRAVVLAWVASDCDCVTSKGPTEIPAGADGHVNIQMFTKGYHGTVLKRMVYALDHDNSQRLMIHLSAKVVGAFLNSPPQMSFSASVGETRVMQIQLVPLPRWSTDSIQIESSAATDGESDLSALFQLKGDSIKAILPNCTGHFACSYVARSRKPGGVEEETAHGQISFDIANPLFSDADLLVGVVRSDSSEDISRTFRMKRPLKNTERLTFDAADHVRLTLLHPSDRDATGEPSIRISAGINRRWTAGAHNILSTLTDSDNPGNRLTIPFRVVMLP